MPQSRLSLASASVLRATSAETPGNRAARFGAQAGLDLAQAFPGRQRREGQGQKLAAARGSGAPCGLLLRLDTALERFPLKTLRPLGKNRSSWLMPRDGTLPLSVWNKTTTLPNAPHPFQAVPYGIRSLIDELSNLNRNRSEIC